MVDGRDDELLERLRRANPISAPTGGIDPTRAGAMGALPHVRFRLTRGRRRHDVAGDAVDGLLRAANPHPSSELDAAAHARADLLFASLTAPAPPRLRLPRPGRRGVAVVIIATASLAASAFGYVVAQRNVTDATSVRCYQSASLGADYVGITEGPAGPVGTCRAIVWQKGGFGAPSGPPLVGCVLAEGVEAVFPGRGDAVCTRLNLSAALAPTASARHLAKLRRLLIADLDPGEHCLAPVDPRPVVLADLDRTGLSGWAVRIAPGTSTSRPCTQAYVLTTNEVIELDPFPRLVDHRPVATTPGPDRPTG